MKIKHWLLVLLIALIPAAALAQTATGTYSFEFLDRTTSQPLSSYPEGRSPEIVVASQNADVRQSLPITLTLLLDGNRAWSGTIQNNPQNNCRGSDGCSVRGPTIREFNNRELRITATDKNGRELATFTQGTPSQTPTPTATPTSPTVPATTTTRGGSSVPYTWWFGLFFGLVSIFVYGYVGRQWWRLRFWNFRWPRPIWFFLPAFWIVPWFFWGVFGIGSIWWPWVGWWWLAFAFGLAGPLGWIYYLWSATGKKWLIWRWPGAVLYFVPLFWFVPWFFWWPFSWLAWSGGWFWSWWLIFPWGFFAPWWVIVFKEKEIWLWNELK